MKPTLTSPPLDTSASDSFRGREGLSWAVLAAAGRSEGMRYLRDWGVEPRLVLEKADLMIRPRRLRERIGNAGVEAVLVHSMDWRRQRNPQLYEVALALMPVRHRYIVDERTGTVHRVGTAELAARACRLPADGLQATGSIVSASVRLTRSKALRRLANVNGNLPASSGGASVLAIWPGSGDHFGGSLTHITGILGALRTHGFRVALLTCFPLPQVLLDSVDDFRIIPSLPAGSRLTGDTEQIGSDSRLTRVGLDFAEHVQPSFVYQRHSPFLLAGGEIARRCKVPLVLEWNGSEVWVRNNWSTQLPVEHLLDPLLAGMEREIVSNAALVSAVSAVAAEMALDAGARADKTFVVPSAVDIEEVDASVDGHCPAEAGSADPLLGWAGSFGSWHGAPLAVAALARLPREVRLVMIGDGDERRACESLAESLEVRDRIEWTGVLPRRAALRRLSECDVLLSPHTPLPNQPFFGSPTKIFEYMALGKPIVVSRLEQLGELFEDRVTARLVTPGAVDELADAVWEILQSPDRGRALGDAARAQAVRNHTWDQRARLILRRLGYDVEVGAPRLMGVVT